MLLGVNFPSATFGDQNVPGTFGTDYTYPTHQDIDYFASKGMDVIRLGFEAERVQPNTNGPLDPAELARMDDIVNYAASKGIDVVLDMHDYGTVHNMLVGTSDAANAAFADVWGKLASHFADNSNVIFGLMNEPNQQSASDWIGGANAAIAAIRQAGATQEVLVPGSYWDGAASWTTSDNAAVVGTQVHDPLHNYAFEVHNYLDSDGSGTHANVVSDTIGVERLTAVTQWAEATGNKLFLGEFGVASDPTSLKAMDNMLSYMQQHSDVWQGGTYWAAGPWWGNYMFSVEPENGVDQPQMAVLNRYTDGATHSASGTGGTQAASSTTATNSTPATDPGDNQTAATSSSSDTNSAPATNSSTATGTGQDSSSDTHHNHGAALHQNNTNAINNAVTVLGNDAHAASAADPGSAPSFTHHQFGHFTHHFEHVWG
ncbi:MULTISPECIES: glycoside hydrolase family 5 protein [unclassified Bradyrhizobium]|uniref:glycoside hydrolase family 5 protein n=1 Tax=unclassified Bradyrhizobium TaxID=2631580 RepID=UPI00247B137D|nr:MULTISPECIES: glycoside hydrolase family 5 protein [unclassified Bradyrhizobium]WGR69261.1 cellulase family glycosylhydrolase [Bradyrhizobium sp. ISRA426]WGR81316.1 cellulase family glycosylhydrolase [Bradyrhizobium sp. ISRA430]WGR84500.1 cellulase family glycosylhydrolase [Bradyrhizobium sp. ISRA432]